jgi:hypothetical protein
LGLVKINEDDIFLGKIAGYVRRLVYPFLVLAVVGLVLTLIAHLSMWAGSDNSLVKHYFALFIGIFVIWPLIILVSQLLTRDTEQKDFWKVCLRGCPAWARYMSTAFFIYAFIMLGFMLFGMYTDIRGGGSGDGMPKFFSLGFSAFCMMCYSTATAVLYSATKILGGVNMRSCPNGHRVEATENFCPYCGEQMTSH